MQNFFGAGLIKRKKDVTIKCVTFRNKIAMRRKECSSISFVIVEILVSVSNFFRKPVPQWICTVYLLRSQYTGQSLRLSHPLQLKICLYYKKIFQLTHEFRLFFKFKFFNSIKKFKGRNTRVHNNANKAKFASLAKIRLMQ